MRMRLLALAVCAGAVVTVSPAAAAGCEAFPKHGNIPVVDAANVIDADDEAYLTADLMAYRVMGQESFVAATVPDLGGDDISSYAGKLFDCWGIGDAASDDGVLILLAMRERRVRVEVGAGLEDRLSEADLETAIDAMVAPLRAGDVGGGMRAAAVSLADDLGSALPDSRNGRIGGARPTRAPGDVDDVVDDPASMPVGGWPGFSFDENTRVSPYAPSGGGSPGAGLAVLVPVMIVLGIVAKILGAVFRGGFGGGGSTWRGGFGSGYSGWGAGSMFRGGGWHDSGSSGWSGGDSSGWSGGGSSSGGSDGSSGSSGSSFGGGSSGGGGASGSW